MNVNIGVPKDNQYINILKGFWPWWLTGTTNENKYNVKNSMHSDNQLSTLEKAYAQNFHLNTILIRSKLKYPSMKQH